MSKTKNKANQYTVRSDTSVFQATARKSGNSTVVTIPGEIVDAMELEGKRVRVLIENNEQDTSPKHLFFMSEDGTKSIGIWADGDIIAYTEPGNVFTEEHLHPLDDPVTFNKLWTFIRELDNKEVN